MSLSQQLKTKKALSQAKKAIKEGNTALALELYNSVLQHQPNQPIAQKGLSKLQKELSPNQSGQMQAINPHQDQINTLINLYQSGQMAETEQACKVLLQTFPQSLTIINLFGAALLELGKLHEAVEVYGLAIQLNPNCAEFYNNRGLAHHKLGQLVDALESYNQAIHIRPNYAESYYNRGNVLNDLEQLADAVESYTMAIKLRPEFSESYYNRGNTLKDLGLFEDAVTSYDKLIQLKPDFAEGYNSRGLALQHLGLLEDAVGSYDKAIQSNPSFAEAYSNRGLALKELAQLVDAVESCDKAIQINPCFAEAYNNRGLALKGLGRFNDALANYDKAIHIKTDFAEAYNNRGLTLQDLGRLNDAVESFEKAIELNPDFAEAYNNHGNLLQEFMKLNDAVKSYDMAIKVKPEYSEAYSNRGTAFKSLGLRNDAVESYEKAISLSPHCPEAHLNIGTLKAYQSGDSQIKLMERLFSKAQNDTDCIHFSFALAKAYDDLGEYTKSFGFLKEGNRLRKKQLNYDIDNDRKLVSKIKDIFSVQYQPRSVDSAEATEIRPIFIIGMPRSGTSLTEQILATHSKVHGAGELKSFAELVLPIVANSRNYTITNQDKSVLSMQQICSIRNSYLKTLTSLHVPETITIDKMPLNFLWVGFIVLAFPQAKIINLNRDPMATCWSIYKHCFSAKGNGYAYDMGDLAKFYKLYIDLMSFWRERFPNTIYDLYYETLTENQEEETRKLLEFCDLEWEDQCLDFHNTNRVVRTASAAQVRKKMYTGSSSAWKNYEEYLQPLTKGIN